MTCCFWRLAKEGSCRRSRLGQSGQAMAEGIVVLGVLLSVYVAISWLGRIQDMALSAQHASRHAAFQQARAERGITPQDISRHFFSGPAHQWTDRRGQRLLGGKADGVTLSLRRHALSSHAQPGGQGGTATALRRDWEIQDPGIVHAEVQLNGASPIQNIDAPNSAGLRFAEGYPAIYRHTAILTGAGHASGDAHVQQVLGQSELGWSGSAAASYSIGSRISAIMRQVDAAWARPEPKFDWLAPWAGRIPDHHLVATRWRQHD